MIQHHQRSRPRDLIAMCVAALLAAPVALWVPSAAADSHDPMLEPGPFTAVVEAGALVIAIGSTEAPEGVEFELDGCPGGVPPAPGAGCIVFEGETLNDDGDFIVEAADVDFPPLDVEFDSPFGTIDLRVVIVASDDVTGNVDPDTGAATLNAPLQVNIDVGPNGTPDCRLVANVQTTTGTSGALTGSPLVDNRLSVVDGVFALPAATIIPGSPVGFICNALNSELELPAGTGQNTMQFDLILVDDRPPSVEPPPITPPTTPATLPVTPPGQGIDEEGEGKFLPGDSVTATYLCSAADEGTEFVLGLATEGGETSLEIEPVVRMAPVVPSPQQGESFTARFSMTMLLPADLIDSAIELLGLPQVTLQDVEWRIDPHEGVTGDPVVGRPGLITVALVPGQPASADIGPFGGSFTRTSAIGEPVAFASGPLSFGILVDLSVLGMGEVPLNFLCEPTADFVLSSVDEVGVPAEPVTAVPSFTG